MPNVSIVEAQEAASEFLMKTLKANDVRVIGMKKVPDGWEAEAEVYEESAFIKALGLPAKVRDRNIYVVKEDDELHVQSYQLRSRLEEEKEKSGGF